LSSFVSVTRDNGVAVVTIDNPPVNALSFHVREPLMQALAELRDDPSAAAIVIACAARTFVAGADITEFGKPVRQPELRAIIAMLETIAKPTVAAIHGTALGGGLELALGCHFRVADAGARLGLPEVKLGLLPGGGGSVRLPRLVGAEKALAMIVSGTPIAAAEALADGLLDAVFDADLTTQAVRFANEIAAGGGPFTPCATATIVSPAPISPPSPSKRLNWPGRRVGSKPRSPAPRQSAMRSRCRSTRRWLPSACCSRSWLPATSRVPSVICSLPLCRT
jgi:3-hydroxyacyl-CoA dehydrogenase